PILVNLKEIIRFYIKKGINTLLGVRKHVLPVHIFDLNTKIVLCTTLTVLIMGVIGFFVLEYDNSLRGMDIYEKIVQSVFNSLVPRSAGFSSVNPSTFLDITLLIIVIQMIIGGSSQSMAGGIKVNTLGTAVLNLRSVLFGHSRATAYHRTINQASVRRANAVIVISMFALTAYLVAVLTLEPTLPTKSVIFEVVSALFTVGSSLGITDDLGNATKVVLSTAMFLGRVGILSLISGLSVSKRDVSDHYPEDSVIIS
ncbi:MAG: potassium transporter, partial [Muribaculaceae bacterium]|nr:potassium transporter [Muribaculaceae bacterium]